MSKTSKNNRWCFLDRDGVIVKDTGHTHKIEDLEILPRVTEGLLSLQDMGYGLLTVTNQAGIAKKYFTHEAAATFQDELLKRLKNEGVAIHKTYICPHHPEHTGDCDCRKPKTGMLDRAAAEFNITPSMAILVGDKDSDIEAGKRWGCTTFRIINDQYPETVQADYRATDLVHVAELVKQKLRD